MTLSDINNIVATLDDRMTSSVATKADGKPFVSTIAPKKRNGHSVDDIRAYWTRLGKTEQDMVDRCIKHARKSRPVYGKIKSCEFHGRLYEDCKIYVWVDGEIIATYNNIITPGNNPNYPDPPSITIKSWGFGGTKAMADLIMGVEAPDVGPSIETLKAISETYVESPIVDVKQAIESIGTSAPPNVMLPKSTSIESIADKIRDAAREVAEQWAYDRMTCLFKELNEELRPAGFEIVDPSFTLKTVGVG